MAEITERETHTKKWIGSFHTAELAALEYDRWQVRLHDPAARLNFPWGEAPVELAPKPPGVVSTAVAREDREAGVHIAADEEYIEDLRCQYLELAEAEQKIFAERAVDGKVIVLSDDEEHGDDDGNDDKEDFNMKNGG